MARDYTLNLRKEPPKLGKPVPDLGWDEVEQEIEEQLPMHRQVGDHIKHFHNPSYVNAVTPSPANVIQKPKPTNQTTL